ncbi:uncharacterized protein J3D65DRAFT_195586 [Phyllosticta citribraziliensis]|uniref:Uncharacterized protein n=1 Tax=Phyllosticta citribraziliensis TaxID=989973 RepID=A0ABR1M337_9PEZI
MCSALTIPPGPGDPGTKCALINHSTPASLPSSTLRNSKRQQNLCLQILLHQQPSQTTCVQRSQQPVPIGTGTKCALINHSTPASLPSLTTRNSEQLQNLCLQMPPNQQTSQKQCVQRSHSAGVRWSRRSKMRTHLPLNLTLLPMFDKTQPDEASARLGLQKQATPVSTTSFDPSTQTKWSDHSARQTLMRASAVSTLGLPSSRLGTSDVTMWKSPSSGMLLFPRVADPSKGLRSACNRKRRKYNSAWQASFFPRLLWRCSAHILSPVRKPQRENALASSFTQLKKWPYEFPR